MGKLTITKTPFEGLYVVETDAFLDHRGAFARWFCEGEMKEILGNRHIKNVNFSRTLKKGSIRGLHFQRFPCAEMKIVRCIYGHVFDVVVDLRPNSKTYLMWYGVELSSQSMNMIVIPEGFAHGFQTLTENVEMMYLHTEFYCKDLEYGIRYNDTKIGIPWPLPLSDISVKDANFSLIDDNFSGAYL